jgi:hypothetical protein
MGHCVIGGQYERGHLRWLSRRFEVVVKLGLFSTQVLVDSVPPQGEAGLRTLEQSKLRGRGAYESK